MRNYDFDEDIFSRVLDPGKTFVQGKTMGERQTKIGLTVRRS